MEDEVIIGDLRIPDFVDSIVRLESDLEYGRLPKPFMRDIQFDEVYQMGASMGGALYVFTGDNDAEIMYDSGIINMNVLNSLHKQEFKGKIFYTVFSHSTMNWHIIMSVSCFAFMSNPSFVWFGVTCLPHIFFAIKFVRDKINKHDKLIYTRRLSVYVLCTGH